jgi:hypothetical protein
MQPKEKLTKSISTSMIIRMAKIIHCHACQDGVDHPPSSYVTYLSTVINSYVWAVIDKVHRLLPEYQNNAQAIITIRNEKLRILNKIPYRGKVLWGPIFVEGQS